MARKMKNRMRAMSAAPSAMLPNPNRAATSDTTRNTNAQRRRAMTASSAVT